ncbi:MAG: hypothetical protein ABF379_17285 [Akkermansiaceae bacterium]
MKKNMLHHLIWALVAITTFVVGSRINSSDPNQSTEAKIGSKTGISNRRTASTTQESSSPRTRSTRSKSSAKSEAKNNSILTEEGIAELGAIFKEGNLVERRLAFAEMLKQLTPENARQLREQIAHMPQDSPEFREFHYAWGAIAGDEAITHGKDTPKRDMAAALAGWASEDPSSAMTYFDSLSPEEQSNASHMKWGAAFGLADADPQLATEFAIERSQNGDKDAGRMIHIAAAAAMKSGDREAVTQWASNIPEGDLQNTAFQRLAGDFAKEDPAEAVDWASSLPEGEGKYHAVGTSFHQWANRDPKEAANAIASLPNDQQDAATYGYATSVVHKEPAAGVQWAATISDQESRTNAMVDTGRVFYRRDREAAQEWLANANLPDEAIQQITGGK